MDSDKYITAVFKKIKHNLTIVSDFGSVTTAPIPNTDGTDVTITATPNVGYLAKGISIGITTYGSYSTTTIS